MKLFVYSMICPLPSLICPLIGRMGSVNNEHRPAGPILVQLVVGVVHGPVALLLESHAAQVRALHLPHCFKSRLSAWPSGGLLRVKHKRSRVDMDSHPTSVLHTLSPQISPWELAIACPLDDLGRGGG